MKYVRNAALLSMLLVLPLAFAQAEVHLGIGVGVGPVYGGYVAGLPVCPYGYYGYYPYACAPYGFYGRSYFVNGVFIGAGPWYHASSRRDYDRDWNRHDYAPGWDRRDYDRGYYRRDDDGRRNYGRGDEGHDYRGGAAFRGRR